MRTWRKRTKIKIESCFRPKSSMTRSRERSRSVIYNVQRAMLSIQLFRMQAIQELKGLIGASKSMTRVMRRRLLLSRVLDSIRWVR
jgi:hypothetical protein